MALGSIGLTPALFAVLNYLRDRDGAIQQEIGSAMGIDPSTMVALVDQLEESGLANRRRVLTIAAPATFFWACHPARRPPQTTV